MSMNVMRVRLLRFRRFVAEMFPVEGSGLVIGLTTFVIALLLLRIAIFLVSGW